MGGPRRLASAPGGLPAPLTRLFGRDREIAELRDTVARARLLTLVGAPGCGKTRLATEVGAQMAPTFPDGVWFVDLGVLADPTLVPQTVATAMDIQDPPDQRMEDRLVELLASSRLLLLLDNCEHLVDAAAGLAQHLLGGCPSVTVLATSRTALGLAYYVKGDVASGDQQIRNAQLIDRSGHPTVTAHAHFALHFGALLACDVQGRRRHLTATFAAMEDGGLLDPGDSLASCALLAHAEGRLHAAVQLYGGTEALRRRRAASRPPRWRP